MAFDPDAYLAQDNSGFDPDEYLSNTKPFSSADVPTGFEGRFPAQQQSTQQAPTGFEEITGSAENVAANTLGVPLSMMGQAAGSLYGIGESVFQGKYGTMEGAEQAQGRAEEFSQRANIFAPKTEAGQQIAQQVGEQLAPLSTLPPVLPGIMQTLPSRQSISAAANIPASAIANIAESKAANASQKSMGAAQADVAAMRRESAAQLPVDPMLTEGQATRDFNQIRFEQEAAKSELGEPLRQRAAFQHQAIQQSIDSWIDETEAAAPDIRSVGASVDSALKRMSVSEKAKIRAAYRDAEASGEMLEPIRTDRIVSAINDMSSAESTAPVITAAKRELVKLGGAELDESGNLIPKDLTLKDAEQLRKFVNKTTGADPTNINFASEIKSAIDSTTAGSGGDVYRKARRLREEYARKFEDRAIVADLVNTKRGTADRKVALEDVFDRIAFRGSLDDVRFMRRMLQGAGEEGNQAWKEIQGAGLKYIRDEATKNVARDFNGNPMVSPAGLNRAITRLDTDGKLDFLYGKNGANKIRAINDISKVLFTAPPGAVNTSNTASVLLAGLDIMVSGTSGMPLPIASGIRLAVKNVKDRKFKNRITKALGDYEKAGEEEAE